VAKLDSPLAGIYPGYKRGDMINPQVLQECMLLVQNQEHEIVVEWLNAYSEVDLWKYRVKKTQDDIDELISDKIVELLSGDKVPKEFSRNADLVRVYAKSELGEQYKKLVAKRVKAGQSLVDAQKTKARYELALGTIKNMLNTATQVLSYAKLQEKTYRG